MRVVIIEDERAAQEQLTEILKTCGVDIEVVRYIDSVEDSIAFLHSEESSSIDLIFLDIHLSDGYSFSIFEQVEVAIPIIFTTAYDEYALKAFEVNCVDYILKPIRSIDIQRVFNKIRSFNLFGGTAATIPEKLLVIDSWYSVPINISDIALFYRDANKIRVYNYEGRRYMVNMTLEKIEELLCGDKFVRANRQFIVAKEAVKCIESYEGSRALVSLVIDSPEDVIVSRTKVSNFKRWLTGGEF